MSKGSRIEDYTIRVRPLAEADGGGFLAEVVELPGCISDGETLEEAVTSVRGAFEAWCAAQVKLKKPMPPPIAATTAEASGQFRLRLPKSLHAELTMRAESDGVSLNTLVVSMLARGAGARSSSSTKPAADFRAREEARIDRRPRPLSRAKSRAAG